MLADKLDKPTETADYYLELSFTDAAGNLEPGKNTGDIQCRIAKEDWTQFDQSNDYSFDPAKNNYAEWSRVTLYHKGMLVWGVEPGAPEVKPVKDEK